MKVIIAAIEIFHLYKSPAQNCLGGLDNVLLSESTLHH